MFTHQQGMIQRREKKRPQNELLMKTDAFRTHPTAQEIFQNFLLYLEADTNDVDSPWYDNYTELQTRYTSLLIHTGSQSQDNSV